MTERGLTAEKEQPSEEDALVESMRKQAQMRLALEDQVRVNPRIATMFEGLKVNQPRNSAVTYPLVFLATRVLYAAVIVFLSETPQLGNMIMLSWTLLVLCFHLHEKQFEDPAMQKLALVSDGLFFALLVLQLANSAVTTADSTEKQILGYTLMFVVTVALHLNFLATAVQAIKHAKLLY